MIEQKLVPIGFVAVALLAVFAVTQLAYCQDEGYYSLMIQQSPVDAGFISPGVGIQQAAIGEHVTLTAIPKPGYRFIYWMGNVSDASASKAIVVMDAPKIIVAVFERTEHELVLGGDYLTSGQGGGGGGLIGVGANIRGGGSVSAGGPVRPSPKGGYRFPDPPDPPAPPESPDFPVPGNDFPVPGDEVPEPATVVLLGMGGLMFLRRKNR